MRRCLHSPAHPFASVLQLHHIFRRYLKCNSEGLGDIAGEQVVPLTIFSSFAAPASCGYSEVLEQIGRVISQSNRPSTLYLLRC